ncbi:MAG: four helix bundle protein [bacterium]
MSNTSEPKNAYDLAERTAKFGEALIIFLKQLPRDLITLKIIDQLARSGTSIGANYMEADGAESKKDFQHKIAICKKESKETTYWLRMLATTCPDKLNHCAQLKREAHELALIFSAILRSQ